MAIRSPDNQGIVQVSARFRARRFGFLAHDREITSPEKVFLRVAHETAPCFPLIQRYDQLPSMVWFKLALVPYPMQCYAV